MSFVNGLGKKITSWKYKYYELNIVQSMPTEVFNDVLQQYKEQGWEVTDAYTREASGLAYKHCKLRKGNSVLNCAYNDVNKGSIWGPARIIKGLAKEFKLAALCAPE